MKHGLPDLEQMMMVRATSMQVSFFHNATRATVQMMALLAGFASLAAAETNIGRFDPSVPATSPPWQLIRLEKHVPATRFRSVHWDGVDAIEAEARASMALLGRPVDVDLQVTPVLCWRWRVDDVVKGADMGKRGGDDYAARVYVALELPPEAISMIDKAALTLARGIYGPSVPDAAINYVWDNRHPVGTRRPNVYTSRAMMIVRRSGAADARQWVEERVNVLDDAASAFGSARPRALLVAIASDADNTGESARAGFADLHFVARDARCRFEPTSLQDQAERRERKERRESREGAANQRQIGADPG